MDGRVGAAALDELVQQPRLANAGIAPNEQDRRMAAQYPGEERGEPVHLWLARDERGLVGEINRHALLRDRRVAGAPGAGREPLRIDGVGLRDDAVYDLVSLQAAQPDRAELDQRDRR